VRILIADKDPYDLESMRGDLAAPDVEVVTARDGREVVSLAAERRPDVIVMNASLGQMGGFAVSRDVKMLADRPGAEPAPRVVILLERHADAWLANWSRCDAWTTKPVSAETLRDLIRVGR
jgi:CheY-like chemotaxis protein